MQPSTDWREIIPANEDEKFAIQSKQVADVQALKNREYGKGRFLHRKPVLSAKATVSIYDNLPDYARFGVFANPGEFAAIVRLSNGGFEIRNNKEPDIRGFTFRILGLSGKSALGGSTDHQDFLLINHDSFGSSTSEEFVNIAFYAAKGKFSLLGYILRTHGLVGGLKRLKQLAATVGKPFSGYGAETFNTAAPIAIGPYAAKLQIRPVRPTAAANEDHADNIKRLIAESPVEYEIGLQFFVSEEITPIENPTVVWPQDKTPFIAVGKLTLLNEMIEAEGEKFDPWAGGLEEHRPLGEIMRARKPAYFASQKGRA